MKEKVAYYLDDIETPIGLTANLVILGLILLSLVIFVTETYPIGDSLAQILHLVDLGILVIFTIEYSCRFWSSENKARFFFSGFSLIDLIAIFPLVFGVMDIRFIRIFRWFRLLRIIRFWRLETKILGIETEDALAFAKIFLTLFSLIFIYAGLIFQVESPFHQGNLNNFFDAFYFVVVTMTTVGYGDVTPLSEAGKAMTLMMISTGVLFIPWQLRELVGQFQKNTNVVQKQCRNCNLSRHDIDANFCKQCGASLEVN
ncbi:Ion transport protein [Xenococcus sp. PCC 7305]|uniref:ion transporter n=1 Tax=Xenococcus sp. PCC 7305 TaxID=102125 RepID=UPI0002AC2C46|nr:Ion transport protein [Xenococcus sp. PCC 7305]